MTFSLSEKNYGGRPIWSGGTDCIHPDVWDLLWCMKARPAMYTGLREGYEALLRIQWFMEGYCVARHDCASFALDFNRRFAQWLVAEIGPAHPDGHILPVERLAGEIEEGENVWDIYWGYVAKFKKRDKQRFHGFVNRWVEGDATNEDRRFGDPG